MQRSIRLGALLSLVLLASCSIAHDAGAPDDGGVVDAAEPTAPPTGPAIPGWTPEPLPEREPEPFEEAEAGHVEHALPREDAALVLGSGSVSVRLGESVVPLFASISFRRGQSELLEAGEVPLTLRSDGHRADAPLGSGVEAWYATEPDGVEQGWSVATRLGASDEGALEVELTLGDDVRVEHESDSLVRVAVDDVAISYGALRVIDAEQHELPSHFASRDGALVISIDDAGASYPISIDPLIAGTSGTLHPTSYTAGFGSAVAVSGDIMLVGQPDMPATSTLARGSVHVFQRSGGSWVRTHQLRIATASGLLNTYDFGSSVALVGNWAVIGAPGYNQGRGAVFTTSLASIPADDVILPFVVTSPDATVGVRFGHALDLGPSGTRLIVGTMAGNRAYLFEWGWVNYVHRQTFTGTGLYGSSVSIDEVNGRRALEPSPFGGQRDHLISFDVQCHA